MCRLGFSWAAKEDLLLASTAISDAVFFAASAAIFPNIATLPTINSGWTMEAIPIPTATAPL